MPIEISTIYIPDPYPLGVQNEYFLEEEMEILLDKPSITLPLAHHEHIKVRYNQALFSMTTRVSEFAVMNRPYIINNHERRPLT